MSSNAVLVAADKVPFEELCTLFDSLKIKKKNEKFFLLTNYIDDFRLQVAQITEEKDSSFYPILRLLLPALERDRNPYNIKEARLGNILVRALDWNRKSQDSQKLLNPHSNKIHHKDYVSVVCDVLKTRVSETSSLTIGDINEILDNIANAESEKAPTLEDIFGSVLKKINVKQLRWFLRIILKDLKLNMGAPSILAAFHPDAEIYYNNCRDLKKVCKNFDSGNTRPSEMGVSIFSAISPMLLQPLFITKLSDLSTAKSYVVEEKFDGERFQIHMADGVFEYYSRNGKPYSHNYGKTYESGTLTPSLKGCFSSEITSFILDGEMVGWHKTQDKPSSKGMRLDVKELKDHSEYKPCFFAFDLLYHNGQSLVGPPEKGGLPLIMRLETLDTMFEDVRGVIYRSERKLAREISDIEEAFNKSIDDAKEGITVKDTESYYMANRRNAGWYKIKAEYTEGTIEDLDLVIIGRTLRHPSQYYVACVDNTTPGGRWLCVAKVGGLDGERRAALRGRLQPHWRPVAEQPPPPSLHFNKKCVDYWLPPESSVVLQVRASELVKRETYGTGYTLRFQRIIEVRYDKPVKDAMTLQEFEQMVSSNAEVVKLGKKVNPAPVESAAMVPRKRPLKGPLRVAEQFRAVAAGGVAATSRALLGRKLCVVSDDADCDKAQLVRIIESHGGRHEENYGVDTWCCVAGRLSFHVRKLIESNAWDIVSTSWLRGLPEADKPCTLSPLDMLSIKRVTRLRLSFDYDCFGDSYKEPLDVDTLKRCFEKMDSDEPKVYLTTHEKIKVDNDLFESHNPMSFLRSCFLAIPNSDSIYSLRARMYGATLCDLDSGNVTHVVLSKMASPLEKMAAKRTNAALVTEEWLDACFAAAKLVPETLFIL
ncbi:unnamed protein product, partial [Iphiclides podalirius]